MTIEAKCRDCVFWEPPRTVSYSVERRPVVFGQCRRYPPVSQMTEAGRRSLWPMTMEDWWCGEHATEAAP